MEKMIVWGILGAVLSVIGILMGLYWSPQRKK